MDTSYNKEFMASAKSFSFRLSSERILPFFIFKANPISIRTARRFCNNYATAAFRKTRFRKAYVSTIQLNILDSAVAIRKVQ